MNNKNTNLYLIGGGLVAAIIIYNHFFGVKIIQVPPKGTGTRPNFDPSPISARIYNCMKGVNFFPCSDSYQEILNLPYDDEEVAVYNHFNKNFGNGETLSQWIEDEMTDYGTTAAKNKLLIRLYTLNLY
jgi:hypothetical protein